MDRSNIRLKAYNQGSASAKLLADALGVRRVRQEDSKWVNGPDKALICWGVTDLTPALSRGMVLNDPQVTRAVSNKKTFFESFFPINDKGQYKEGSVPWTTSFEIAKNWLAEKYMVFARKDLTGHSGSGIIVMEWDKPESWDKDAPLYTLYVPKKEEYRVHVAFGNIIDVQMKKRRIEVDDENVNWKIRNLSNGFIYAREDVKLPKAVEKTVMSNLIPGLDFGAYDIVYNQKQDAGYILEVNTAPGLAGTTLDRYTNAFVEYLKVNT